MINMFRICYVFTFLAGCMSYELTPTTTAPTTSKAPCDFRVVNLPPHGDYEEIAALTPDGRRCAMNPNDFKSAVRDNVCRVGGDVVITEVNGFGCYVRGTVLRERSPAGGTMPNPTSNKSAGN